mmetsp:Transcript_272/g.388  ORF Transcript_272/g.388 Transcript_272/m.388 type:complete len:187 (+) Transcript_272:87-647(+)
MNPRQLPQMDIIEHFPIPVQQQEEEISWTASSQQQVEFPQHQQDTTTTMLLVSPASKKTKNQEPLPLQLMKILDTKEDSYGHIISWNHDGKSFTIHDRKELSKFVLPEIYEHYTFFSVFLRQLYRWRFTRMSNRIDDDRFHHELFVRGNIELCKTMTTVDADREYSHSDPESSDNSSTLASLLGLL